MLRFNLKNYGHLRYNPQAQFNTGQLARVLVDVAINERIARQKDLNHATSIGKRHAIQANGFLPPAHGSIAGATSTKRICRGIMEEGINFIRIKYFCDQLYSLLNGIVDINGRKFEQALKSG